MPRKYWGVCANDGCYGWGDAPPEFNEKFHFLRCTKCGSDMYLTIHDPREAGHRENNKVPVTVRKHGGK